MTDQEWQQYLATLPSELADALYHTMERINTLLNRERHKTDGEYEVLEQQVTDQRTQINNLRTIVKDLFDRVVELEQSKTKAVNDAGAQA